MKKVFIPSKGEKIYAEFYSFPKRPLVVMCHGFPGTNRNDAVAKALAKQKINVLNIKYRGVEESSGVFGFVNAIEDVFSVVEYSKQLDIDHSKIGLFGYSTGVVYMAYAATKLKDDISLAIFLSPNIDLEKTWTTYKDPNGFTAKDFFEDSTKIARGNPDDWWAEHEVLKKDFNPTEFMSKIECPVLCVHAVEDEELPSFHVELLRKLNNKIKIVSVKDTDHYFKGKLSLMTGTICNFVKKQWKF